VTALQVARVPLSRAEVADIFLEGVRLADAGSDHPAQTEGETDEAYALRLADHFTDLALELNAGAPFNPSVYALDAEQRAQAEVKP